MKNLKKIQKRKEMKKRRNILKINRVYEDVLVRNGLNGRPATDEYLILRPALRALSQFRRELVEDIRRK